MKRLTYIGLVLLALTAGCSNQSAVLPMPPEEYRVARDRIIATWKGGSITTGQAQFELQQIEDAALDYRANHYVKP